VAAARSFGARAPPEVRFCHAAPHLKRTDSPHGILQARLAKLKDAGTDELREKAELQEALIRRCGPWADLQ
jgi:hypothetical protein